MNQLTLVQKKERAYLSDACTLEVLMASPNLAKIESGMRETSIKLAIANTTSNPNKDKIEYKALAKILAEISGNGNDNDSIANIEQVILKVLHENSNYRSFEPNGGKIRFKRNVYSVAKKYKVYVPLEKLHTCLVAMGNIHPDPRIKAYIECHHELAVHYRDIVRSISAFDEDRRQKQTLLFETRLNRQSTIRDNELSVQAGVGANSDKYLLSKVAPGPGSQKSKIALARNNGKPVRGSAMSNLNPTEAGLVAGILARTTANIKAHSEELETLPLSQRKRRFYEISKETIDGFGCLTYAGLSAEENLKRVYDPVTAATLTYFEPSMDLLEAEYA